MAGDEVVVDALFGRSLKVDERPYPRIEGKYDSI
jgi:hypothetical protein